MKKTWRLQKVHQISKEIEEVILKLRPENVNQCCTILEQYTQAIQRLHRESKSKKWRRRIKLKNKRRNIKKFYKEKTRRCWKNKNKPTRTYSWEDDIEMAMPNMPGDENKMLNMQSDESEVTLQCTKANYKDELDIYLRSNPSEATTRDIHSYAESLANGVFDI